jgi:hypothetical protein
MIVICHVAGDTLYSMLCNYSDTSASAVGKLCDDYFDAIVPT